MKYKSLHIRWTPRFKVNTSVEIEEKDNTEIRKANFVKFLGFSHYVEITDDTSLTYWIKEFEKMADHFKNFNKEHKDVQIHYYISITGWSPQVHNATPDMLVEFLKDSF